MSEPIVRDVAGLMDMSSASMDHFMDALEVEHPEFDEIDVWSECKPGDREEVPVIIKCSYRPGQEEIVAKLFAFVVKFIKDTRP